MFPKLPLPTAGFEVKFGDSNGNRIPDASITLILPGGVRLPLGTFDVPVSLIEDFISGAMDPDR